MKRAYNYFFGGAQPAPAPAEPSSPVTSKVTAASIKDEETARENGQVNGNGIDTPPETPRAPEAPAGEDAGTCFSSFLSCVPG
jgi:hypothetical protein